MVRSPKTLLVPSSRGAAVALEVVVPPAREVLGEGHRPSGAERMPRIGGETRAAPSSSSWPRTGRSNPEL